jgi:hypothetical protein
MPDMEKVLERVPEGSSSLTEVGVDFKVIPVVFVLLNEVLKILVNEVHPRY